MIYGYNISCKISGHKTCEYAAPGLLNKESSQTCGQKVKSVYKSVGCRKGDELVRYTHDKLHTVISYKQKWLRLS